MRNKELTKQYHTLKCKHTETILTIFNTYNGGKTVCFQCSQCGAGVQEIRKSKSGFNIS